MQDLFEPEVVDEAEVARKLARRRARTCFLLLALLFGLHAWTGLRLVEVLPFTSNENRNLVAGMALRSDFLFAADDTIQHGPLPFYANQAATLWDAEYDFPYEPTATNKIHGRLGMLVFTLVTFLLLARLAWRHVGPIGAVAACACYALNPIVLAHSVLMNADLALTATYLLTVIAAVHHFTRPGPYRAAALGAAFGLAMTTSYAAIVLLPVLLIVTGLWLYSPAEEGSRRSLRLAPLAGHLLMGGIAALITIHVCYQFDAPLYDPDKTPPKSDLLMILSPITRMAMLLPDPLVRGLDLQMVNLRAFETIPFLGEMRPASAWYYVVALGTKLPLAFLALLAISLLARRGQRPWPKPLTWTISSAVAFPFLYLSVFADFQPGVRVMLPLLPLLILFAVRPVEWLVDGGKQRRLVALGILVWLALGAALSWPNYLSAFNALAGSRPYNLFGDTTMDWRMQPHRDPTRNHLFREYPKAEAIHFRSGPRFGVMIVHAKDLWPRDDKKRGPVHHWLREFEPIDRAGPYFVFKLEEDHFRLGLFDEDPRVGERNRRGLAIALLGAGKFLEVDALLEKGDDLPLVRQQLDRVRANPKNHPTILAGWMQLGRYDHVLGSDHATPQQLGQCFLELGRYHEVRRVLEAEMKGRQLSLPEQQILILAQTRDRALDRAIITSRRHPPLVGTDHFRIYEDFIASLQQQWNEYEQLMRQIGARPSK